MKKQLKKPWLWLKNLEFTIFKALLKRFAEKDLDQWERWELETQYGKVYVQIDRAGDGHTYHQLK